MTDVVVLLDASGSMQSMGPEPVQALNAFIKEQQKSDLKGVFSLYTFASEIKKVYDHVDLATVGEYEKYVADGMTCLFDCIKQAISDNEERKNVVFVIITDGNDTSSKNCNSEEAKKLIAIREKDYNWQLVFLGANKNAFKASADLGIGGHSSKAYSQQKVGDLSNLMRGLSAPIAAYRAASTTSPYPQKLDLSK